MRDGGPVLCPRLVQSNSAASISPVTHFPFFVRVSQARKVHVDCDENTPGEVKWLSRPSMQRPNRVNTCEYYLSTMEFWSGFHALTSVDTNMKRSSTFTDGRNVDAM